MAENTQLALIEAESDDALFLEGADMQKRFTATTVEKIELKREFILSMLAAGLPVDSIALRAHTSNRVVNLLGAKYAQQIASDIPNFAKALRTTAAKALAIASGKLEGAKLGELAVFIGVTTQRAGEMELAAAGVSEDSVTNIEAESPALASAREFLRKNLTAENAETNNKETKEQSKI